MKYRIALFAATALLVASADAAEGPRGHTHGPHGDTVREGTDTDGGPGKASDVKRVVQVEARNPAFNVKQIQVRAGETIKFVVTNKSTIAHEFAIASSKEHEGHRAMMRDMPDMVHEEPNVVTIKPGETKELIWKFGNDTDLEFACNIPGHAEQGMIGKFRVMR